MFKVFAVHPGRSAVLIVFRGTIRRSLREPLWNHGDHRGATAVYAVQAPQWHRASSVNITNTRFCATGRSNGGIRDAVRDNWAALRTCVVR